jgi:hypothetical protein
MPVKKISREEARAMWPSEAEAKAAEAERAAVVGERAIDAAAKYLRETNQAGKRLTPWEETPKSTKRKWLALAEGALRAAIESRQHLSGDREK